MKTILIFDSHPVCLKGCKIAFEKHADQFRLLIPDSFESFLKMLPDSDIELVIFGMNETWNFNLFPKQYFKKKNWIAYYSEKGDSSALELIRLGATGCISKRCSEKELISCTNIVAAGKNYFCQNTFLLISEELFQRQTQLKWEEMSLREIEIANLLISGMATVGIARSLNLSASTISNVKSRIFKKMHVTNILALNSKKQTN